MSELCVILGNGPSLKGFDLHRLAGVTSLGMNAAYRYWDQIDWYPDYYACLDDQLILSHHDEIYRLWKEGRIQKFFLHSGFYDFHPDCIGRPEFHSLDQVLPHWYNKRGKKQGWEDLTQHPAFLTSDTTKITTGAFATRFGAFMGHSRLALMGIDLKYVEILPEAEKTEGVGLVIKQTPKSNPNYFFDGYQQAGDKYNIPNPDVHNNRLHIESFRLIPVDFALTGQQTEIFNTNPNSLLEDEKVFALHSIGEMLVPHKLGAVVVPTTQFEIDAVLRNFEIWGQPGWAPLHQNDTDNRCALVFMFNNDQSREHEATIRAKFAETRMKRYFSYLGFKYLGLEGDDDKYERDYSKKVGSQGYKSGPNNQFFHTMQEARDLGIYAFQMETDCVPLRSGWLSVLRTLCAEAEPFWILGSRYHGVETLSPAFKDHLNGNAVYATGDPGFQRFLDEFWEPRTRQMVAGVDRRLAYDCILEKVFTEQRDSDPEVAALLETHGDKFRATQYILNISGKRDLEDLAPTYRRDLLKTFPDAYVLHNRTAQKRTTEEVAVLRAAQREEEARYPRLLILDMTAMGNGTATGEVKSTLLGGWPRERLVQVARHGSTGLGLIRPGPNGSYPMTVVTPDEAAAAIDDFAPDVILYRQVPDVPALHAFAMQTIERLNRPLVTWMMDDWPEVVAGKDPEQWKTLGPDLEMLLERSAVRLSICDAMSGAFAQRYGHRFEAFANAVDPADWGQTPRSSARTGLLIRYAGGLAPNMNRNSVLRVARAVEILAQQGYDISFEINTASWWHDQSRDLFADFAHTRLETTRRSSADYRRWLQEADVVLIAYSFDDETLRYVRYSMANKMPECLASGAVLLAHGASGIATIDYLRQSNDAVVVTERSEQAVMDKLKWLLDTPDALARLSEQGRARAFEHHNLHTLREKLRQAIVQAAAEPRLAPELIRVSQPVLAALMDRSEAGRSLLSYCAMALMLDRLAFLERLRGDAVLQAAIDRALGGLPESDTLRRHFLRLQPQAAGPKQ